MKTTKRGKELSAYPKNSKKQDPYQELDEIFDYAHIDELEIQLWEWLKTTVSGSFHKELSRVEKSSLLTLYEKMQQLLGAAHCIHQQTQKGHSTRRMK